MTVAHAIKIENIFDNVELSICGLAGSRCPPRSRFLLNVRQNDPLPYHLLVRCLFLPERTSFPSTQVFE